jgi:hypothetical protein
MIPYDQSEDPPFIAMNCTIINPVTGTIKRGRGKFDTGAPLTFIPESWTSQLGLMPNDIVEMGDYRGQTARHSTYIVNLELNGFSFDGVEVAACPRSNILIARDLHNRLNVLLYGRNLQFDVRWP